MANIQCALCEDYFNDPRMLPCLHTYCLSCLQKEKNDQQMLTCPGCKETIKIQGNDLDLLPRNLRKVHEVQCTRAHDKLENTNEYCQACGRKESSGKAVAFCFECDEYLCTTCKDLHEKRAITKNHTLCVIGAQLMKEKDSKTLKFFQSKDKCPLHPEYLLESYCQRCETMTCRICREYDHQSHIDNCRLIDKVVGEEMDTLEAHKDVCEVEQEVLDGAIAKCEATIHAVKERAREVDEEIENSLEEVKRALMMQNRQVCETKIADLDSQHAELEKLKGCISEVSGLMHDFHHYTPVEKLSIHRVITCRASSLKAVFQQYHGKLSPKRSSEFITHISSEVTKARMISLGSLSSGGHHPPGACDAGYLLLAAVGTPRTVSIVAIDKEGKRFNCGGDKVEVSFVHMESKQPAVEGNIKVRDNGDGSYCATFTPKMHGKHELKITIVSLQIKGSPFICHVHLTRPTPLSLSPQVWIPTSESPSLSLSCPSDIAVNDNGYLIVAEYGNHTVTIHSKEHHRIFSFGLVNNRGSLNGQFHSPLSVAVRGKYLFVCDSGNHRIQKFDLENYSFVLKFGCKGKEDGQLLNPGGIALDGEGMVFVADTENHRIQVFSENGVFSHSFACGKQPQGLAFDHHGHLHVAIKRTNSIHVFKPDGTVVTSYGTGVVSSPVGIAINGEGYIAISESGGHKGLRIYRPDYTQVYEMARQFKIAGGMACDSYGNFWVADCGNNSIIKY